MQLRCKNRFSLVRLLCCLAVLSASLNEIRADWPERPVRMVVPAGVGGGTDRTARMIATRLEARFGQPFNIVNQGQGSGIVGFQGIKMARPDGYTLGVIYNFAHYKSLGQADLTAADFRPVAQYNFDPAAFHVRSNHPWTSLTQALNDIKARPHEHLIACGGGCGGSWSIALAALLDAWGVELGQVILLPGRGAAEALQSLIAGGVDAVPSSLPEAAALIDAGYVRPLAVFGSSRSANFPDVPSVAEETGFELNLGAWRGIVFPRGVPESTARALEDALAYIVASPDWRAEMAQNGFGVTWRNAAEFEEFLEEQEMEVSRLMAKLRW